MTQVEMSAGEKMIADDIGAEHRMPMSEELKDKLSQDEPQYWPKPGATKERERRELCLLYTSPSPRDRQKSRMPSSA